MNEPIRILKNPIHFLSFGFGAGLLPRAPGTWGTLVAVPLFYLFSQFSTLIYSLIVASMFCLGIWLCHRTTLALQIPDHPAIVWDEIVGFLAAMLLVPANIAWVIAGFLLFRLFDIWKPFPIQFIDSRIKGGLGIMADDLIAALYTGLILQMALAVLALKN